MRAAASASCSLLSVSPVTLHKQQQGSCQRHLLRCVAGSNMSTLCCAMQTTKDDRHDFTLLSNAQVQGSSELSDAPCKGCVQDSETAHVVHRVCRTVT
jgi:hypothetical protein